jgi:hypothetical protein
MGNAFIVILIVLFAVGAVVMLVRGIITFLKTTEEDLRNSASGPSQSSLKQNRMMMGRVTFQALAILMVALLLLINGRH